MRNRLATVVGAFLALALGFGLHAISQPVVQNTLSGNECWNSGQGPGGPSTGFVCTNLVRNGQGVLLVSGSGSATTLATTNDAIYHWTGTAPTTWTVTTPAVPMDGETLILATDTTLTTMVTLTANTGQTLNATYNSQTLTAVTSVQWFYDLPTTKWYRIR